MTDPTRQKPRPPPLLNYRFVSTPVPLCIDNGDLVREVDDRGRVIGGLLDEVERLREQVRVVEAMLDEAHERLGRLQRDPRLLRRRGGLS